MTKIYKRVSFNPVNDIKIIPRTTRDQILGSFKHGDNYFEIARYR